MEETKTLIYDGSFNGFLTAIFFAFEQRTTGIIIQRNNTKSNSLFSNTVIIFTDMKKAQDVWKIIQNKNNAAIKNIYFAFLSEKKSIENQLFLYIKNLFNPYLAAQIGYSISLQIKLENLAHTVAKEKKYLEKRIEFQSSKDGVYFANIAPENDILPLLSKYFRVRFSTQPWLIFDIKRNYGIYYSGFGVEVVSIDTNQISNSKIDAYLTINKGKNKKITELNKYFQLNNINTLVLNKLHSGSLLNGLSHKNTKRIAI